jgi:hypothetical protein
MAAEEAIQAIHRAAMEGDPVSVTRMLEEDPRLLSSAWNNHTLLSSAACYGPLECVRLLLERGGEINKANRYGDTTLDLAVLRGHEEMVSMLLSSGADIHRKAHRGQTALMCASINGHVAVVRLLLWSMEDRGLDERDEDGRTALCYACVYRYADVLRVLLLAGADHTIADNHDTTPLQIAQEREHHDCVGVIQVSTRPSCHVHKVLMIAPYSRPVMPFLFGVAPHILRLCCSGGRASCSVPMSSTRPGLYLPGGPRANKQMKPVGP